jgi:ADP-ribosyl-[dinitrogen reductase] hydrolase
MIRASFLRAKIWAEKSAPKEVLEWLQDAENNVRIPFYPQSGYIKIGFVHAFRHLLLGTSYQDAIK